MPLTTSSAKIAKERMDEAFSEDYVYRLEKRQICPDISRYLQGKFSL